MKYLFLFTALFYFSAATSQNNEKRFSVRGNLNFYNIKAQADFFFDTKEKHKSKDEDNAEFEEEEDSKKYKRWEWYWKNRVLPNGDFPDLTEQQNIYKLLQNNHQNRANTQWVNISQTTAVSGYDGMGRVTSVAFHPTQVNTFWVGAPIGGIWKTTNNGQSYTALGDSLPYCSVGNIAVNYQNPDIIYITIGDHNGWWKYGLGVYKTIDGGQTWAPTGLTSLLSVGRAYYKMVMSPTNPDVLLVTTTSGLYRTINGGVNWQVVQAGAHTDVAFKPNDANIVYATSDDYWGHSEVYKSTNGGANFTAASQFNTLYNKIILATSPAAQGYLGILCSANNNYSYYDSHDAANTINLVSTPPQDAVVFCSPTDSNKIYNANLDVYKSINGGGGFSKLTNWYDNGMLATVHADNHFITYNPLNMHIYFCNDGGLYRYNESNNTWNDLSNGLIITQFYDISVSQTDPIFMLGGTQDNGGRKRTTLNTWTNINGGDAMVNAINQDNDNTIYTTYIYGKMYRSYDKWEDDTYQEITPNGEAGSWVTPYMLDPNNQNTLVAGYADVFKSFDEGNSWQQLSTNLTGNTNNTLQCLQVAPSNSSTIYTSYLHTLYRTFNDGSNWQTQTINNVGSNDITSIAVHPQHDSTVIITMGGYTVNKKVYKSVNGGATFTNISGSLPNVPANAIIIDKYSALHDMYLGTDVGVFTRNDTLTDWEYYGLGLPNTSVTDLEIQYNTSTLRIGTFGRGIWETNIKNDYTNLKENIIPNSVSFSPAYNPINDVLLINSYLKKDTKAQIIISDISGKQIIAHSQYFVQGNRQQSFDLSTIAAGIYFVNISAQGVFNSFKIVKVVK